MRGASIAAARGSRYACSTINSGAGIRGGAEVAEVARVARLSEEMDRHLPSPSLPAAALSAAAYPTFLYPIRIFSLVF